MAIPSTTTCEKLEPCQVRYFKQGCSPIYVPWMLISCTSIFPLTNCVFICLSAMGRKVCPIDSRSLPISERSPFLDELSRWEDPVTGEYSTHPGLRKRTSIHHIRKKSKRKRKYIIRKVFKKPRTTNVPKTESLTEIDKRKKIFGRLIKSKHKVSSYDPKEPG